MSGCIFNPLVIADDIKGLDTKLSIKNETDDIKSLVFHEEKMGRHPLFKSAFDNYMGIYCNQEFKDAAEKAGLEGVSFGRDLGNIFPPDPTGSTTKERPH